MTLVVSTIFLKSTDHHLSDPKTSCGNNSCVMMNSSASSKGRMKKPLSDWTPFWIASLTRRGRLSSISLCLLGRQVEDANCEHLFRLREIEQWRTPIVRNFVDLLAVPAVEDAHCDWTLCWHGLASLTQHVQHKTSIFRLASFNNAACLLRTPVWLARSISRGSLSWTSFGLATSTYAGARPLQTSSSTRESDR